MLSYIYDGIEYRPFSHRFAVSRCGKVLRKTRDGWNPFTPKLRKDGYIEAGKNGLLHRLVAICWIDKPPLANIVHHKDGVKENNDASNLEWVTQKQHMGERHAGAIGRSPMSKNARQKLSAFRKGRKDSQSTRDKKREVLIRVSLRKNACEVDGIKYRSFLSASKATGVHFHTVRFRCLSKNFPDYKLLKST